MRRLTGFEFEPIVITLSDYYMGRDLLYPDELDPEKCANARLTVSRANAMLACAGLVRVVNSGWRPRQINARIPSASARSKHMSCQAIDLADDDGCLDRWCMDNLRVLARIGLWLEHPRATPGWCHVQVVAPGSGRRVFMP